MFFLQFFLSKRYCTGGIFTAAIGHARRVDYLSALEDICESGGTLSLVHQAMVLLP
jgi:hypothetical protein